MSVGESQGGLPPDSVVENQDAILADSSRVIESFHDDGLGSMTQVVLAPCSPFSVSQDLMKETAKLARQHKVHMHTHLAETQDEERYTQENFGLRPVAWMETLGWLGDNVWYAHSVHVTDEEIAEYADHGCGVAHCPSANMRLASGVAPIAKMLTAGVKVGLGVDGSASNDSSHMLAEARQAMLLSRLDAGLRGASLSEESAPELMTARQALEVATRGGAAVLGRDDIGSLEVGKCADFFAVNLNQLDFAGGLHDPLAALVFCSPAKADYTVVGGKFIVKEGQMQTVELPILIEKHNRAAKRLLAN
jgi:cytosine/adenosine deaminase-related metal-dependent hydrolase